METITIKQEVKELSRKTIVKDHVDTLVVKNIWDARGSHFPWEDDNGNKSNTYKDVDVLIEKVVTEHKMFGSKYKFEENELFINGTKYEALDIYSAHGDTNKLTITACIGQG